ncbi:uncharacterized protein LOC103506774 [Diaphorina citri]|uniref:Uncharacterized protein LOC103506774 n=1 Tax=Diaphorina citri TaxID=121845 RepID=A0A1S3CWX0_DIACI|nr:uncharacterized protein LOC103506774 [Diaphorina citri]
MLTSKSVLCFGILFISFAFVLSREYEATTSSSIVERVENSARDVYEKVKVPLQKIEEGRDKLASSLDHIRFQLFGGTSTASSLEAKLVKEAQQLSHKVEDTAKNLFVKLSREYAATTSSSIVERVENSARDVYEKVKVPLQKIEEGRDKLASSLDHIRVLKL